MFDAVKYGLTKRDWDKAYADFERFSKSGRNLIPDSNNFERSKWVPYQGSAITSVKAENGYTQINSSGGTSSIKSFYMINYLQSMYGGKEVTLSFDAITGSDGLVIGHNWANFGTDAIPSNFNGKFTTTRTMRTDSAGQIQFRATSIDGVLDFQIRNMKVELGAESPYIQAPEDENVHPLIADLAEYAYRTDQNERKIRELQNAITSQGGGS